MKRVSFKKLVGILGVVILIVGVVIFNAGKGKESIQKAKVKEAQTVSARSEALPCRVKFSVSREPIVNRPFELKIKMKYDWAKEKYNYRFYFYREKEAAQVKILEGATEWVMGGEKREHTIKMVITKPGGYTFHVDEKRGDRYFGVNWAVIYSAKSKGKVDWDAPSDGTKERIKWDKEIATMFKEKGEKYKSKPTWMYYVATTLYYTPSGEIKTWSYYHPSMERYLTKKWEEIDDPEKEDYFPLNYVTSSFLYEVSTETEQLLLAGKPAQALAMLKKVKEEDLKPGPLTVLYNDLGIVYLTLGDWKKGSGEIKKAAQIFKENYRKIADEELKEFLFQNAGVIYAIEGNFEEAAKHFEESLLNPAWITMYGIGWQERQEKTKERLLEKAKKIKNGKIEYKRSK